jgi:HAE1 family hydrophobic/amphiphilic exporter-1
MRALEPIVTTAVPEAVSFITSVGGGGFGGSASNTGNLQIRLKPRGRRLRSDIQIASDLERRVAGIPGLKTRVRTGSGFFLLRLASGGTEQVQLEINGFDVETASRLAVRVQKLVEDVPGVTDARLSRETGVPELHLNIDRIRAADLNLTVSQISGTIQTALAGTSAGALRDGGNEFNILVKLRGAERLGIEEVLDLTVRNTEGIPVVMRNVLQIEPQSGPVRIERKNQERVMYVNAQVRGRVLGSVVKDIREKIKTLPIPEGFTIHFGGDVEEQQRASRELFMNIFLSLVLVYMIMASLYESFRFPFVVMFSVPFAVIGVVLVLFLTGTTFNMQSRVGILMLGGIVVNNAIVLVDHINLLRHRDKMGLVDAIMEAGSRRLRPILMTTITTVCGLLPLAFGLGEGGEAQAPLARAVVGGLTSSTLITLVLIPTIYYLFERRREERAKGEGA